MAGPGNREFGEDLAPRFRLVVQGTDLKEDITKWVQRIEYEQAQGMADLLKLTVLNPGAGHGRRLGFQYPDFTAARVFQPGNEVDLYLGYGPESSLEFIGRTIVARHLPNYDQGVATLQVIGYDKRFLMSDVQSKITGAARGKPKLVGPDPAGDENDKLGQVWQGCTHEDIIREIARRWELEASVETPDHPVHKAVKQDPEKGVVQPKGMSDWKCVQMLANLSDMDTWIKWDPATGKWTLYWHNPIMGGQPIYLFKYGTLDATLLQFRPEYGLRDNITTLVVLAWDNDLGTWSEQLIIEDVEGPDPRYQPGGDLREGGGGGGTYAPTEPLEDNEGFMDIEYEEGTESDETTAIEPLLSASRYRLAAGGVAIDIIARPFRDLDDMAEFAARWFRARKDHFLIGHGAIVGTETVRARQVHRLVGVGPRLSGDYGFVTVRHVFDVAARGSLPYLVEFTANRILKDTGSMRIAG